MKASIHAAALKQNMILWSIKTNILGGQNVISVRRSRAAFPRFIALSTDKAVSSANLYGATRFG